MSSVSSDTALLSLLHFLEALGLVELQTAVLAPPAIIALLRDAEASTDRANRLTLSETDLRFPQKTDDLLCRVSLPCHSLLSSIEVGNSRIRSINLVSLQGSTPTALIISVGGFLGIGEKDVAVPFSSVTQKMKDGKPYLTLDTTKEALKSAPGFAYDSKTMMWAPAP